MEIPKNITATIRDIDRELRDEGVEPHARPMHAIMRFGNRFSIPMPLVPVSSYAPKELVSSNKYCEAIHTWYKNTYGELLLVDMSPGSVIVFANNDYWELRLPRIFGSAVPSSGPDLAAPRARIRKGPVNFSFCNQLVGITPELVKMFSLRDFEEVMTQGIMGLNVLHALEDQARSNTYSRQAIVDLSDSVRNATGQRTNFGQALWSNLMFLEKFIKAQILEKTGNSPPHTHNIKKLIDQLRSAVLGLSSDLDWKASVVQCEASVRYGEATVTREELYTAHKTALEIAFEVQKAV